jgi:hypothetical protein
VEVTSKIGYALNKERFEDDDQGPKNKLEAMEAGAVLYTTLSFRELDPKLKMSIEDLAEACNVHYKENLDSLLDVKEHIHHYLDPETLKKLDALKLDSSRFLVRAGKHSGARAVTIDGLRKIRVKMSGGGPRRKPNEWKELDEETTVWLFGESEYQTKGLRPFGWLLCEVVTESEYLEALDARHQKIDEIVAKRRKAIEEKRAEEERKKAEALRKEEEQAREVERKLEEERRAAERLAAMSPVERLVEMHETSELIQRMQNDEIEDYEEIKLELAQKIKEVLQQDPKKWDKAKKKALKRKEFIQSILGEK